MTGTVHDETIEVTVARTLDQVVMAMTLRGVIYLGEQHAPYTEEYDGNDLVGASHLIAWRGREPSACSGSAGLPTSRRWSALPSSSSIAVSA